MSRIWVSAYFLSHCTLHSKNALTIKYNYRSEYQNLPILPIEEFKSLQNSMEPPLGITKMEPSAEDDESIQEVEHKLMLARLSFELFERKR